MSGTYSGGTWWRSPGWPNPHWVYGNATALSHPYYLVQQSAMLNVPPVALKAIGGAQTAPPTPVNGTGGGTPAIPSTAAHTPARCPSLGAPAASMIWSDANGNAVSSVVCGSTYSMTIPGMEGQQIYLVQQKDGSPQFSGNFSIPMSNYQSICPQDVGTYTASAYSLADGSLIAQGTFQVLPQGSTSTGTASTPAVPGATTATGSTLSVIEGMFSNLTASDWLLIAAGLLVLFKGNRQ